MILIIAKLAAKATKDGITDTEDDVPIGKEYYISMKSLRFQNWGKKDQPELKIPRVSILVADNISGTSNQGWMPVELLEFTYREATETEEQEWEDWLDKQLHESEQGNKGPVLVPRASQVASEDR